jgi:hypothetical protein
MGAQKPKVRAQEKQSPSPAVSEKPLLPRMPEYAMEMPSEQTEGRLREIVWCMFLADADQAQWHRAARLYWRWAFRGRLSEAKIKEPIAIALTVKDIRQLRDGWALHMSKHPPLPRNVRADLPRIPRVRRVVVTPRNRVRMSALALMSRNRRAGAPWPIELGDVLTIIEKRIVREERSRPVK